MRPFPIKQQCHSEAEQCQKPTLKSFWASHQTRLSQGCQLKKHAEKAPRRSCWVLESFTADGFVGGEESELSEGPDLLRGQTRA